MRGGGATTPALSCSSPGICSHPPQQVYPGWLTLEHDAIYRSLLRTSENSPSTHSGEYALDRVSRLAEECAVEQEHVQGDDQCDHHRGDPRGQATVDQRPHNAPVAAVDQ